jgi:pimeloyl-ACP methyl ester carboxylesterase
MKKDIRVGFYCLVLALVWLVGCVSKPMPALKPLQALENRTPVVFIPGISGSQLRERETGRVVWGRSKNFFRPRDGGYSLALPVAPPSGAEDRLEAFAPLIRLSLLGFKIDIYDSLLRTMESNGYRTGDLDAPRPDDSFFFFAYDWRYGNARATQALGRKLENLRKARGEQVLRIHLICHSNASLIARYFIKYGTASIEQAERGLASPPSRIRVDKLILVGTANGGAMGTFEDLHRGRRYVPVLGRRFRPEVLFTFRSMFEALPAYRLDLFVDGQGRELDVDLFDPRSWETHGWSLFEKEAQQRLARAKRDDLFGTAAQRKTYLARELYRSQRLQRLLIRDVEGFGATRYYFVQNVSRPTSDRALLVRVEGEWRTFFSTKRRGKRDDNLLPRLIAPGDGHATKASQQWLSPQEQAAMAAPQVDVPVYHRRIILHPLALQKILEFLLE